MMRVVGAVGIGAIVLIASFTVVLAQGQSPEVLGQTGTMYDGNNADLRLPPEPNRYWADLWAAPLSPTDIGTAPATGGTSVEGPVMSPSAGGRR
jgi:hypothetical protein